MPHAEKPVEASSKGKWAATGALLAVVVIAGVGLFRHVQGYGPIMPGRQKKVALQIRRFSAEPESLRAGGVVTLRWNVPGAKEVFIDQGVGKVAASGAIETRPAASTSYTLTASGGEHDARANAFVRVSPAEPVQKVITAKESTSYKLTADSSSGKTSQQAVVTELAKPKPELPLRSKAGALDGPGSDAKGNKAPPKLPNSITVTDPRIMLEEGKRAWSGKGIPRDQEKAAAWFRKAADAGNTEGMVLLGSMYAQGTGAPRDYVRSVAWFQKAADAGNVRGMDNLGSYVRRRVRSTQEPAAGRHLVPQS